MDFHRFETLGREAETRPENADGWLDLAEALLDHDAPQWAQIMLDRAQRCGSLAPGQSAYLQDLRRRLMSSATPTPSIEVAAAGSPTMVDPGPPTPERPPPSPLVDMLHALSRQRATGTLQLLSKVHSAHVDLVDGRIVDVDYPQRPTLAAELTDRGLTRPLHELPVAVLMDEQALAAALVQRGAISAEELHTILRSRVEGGLRAIAAWAESHAQFRYGAARTRAYQGFDTQALMREAIGAI